MLSNISPTKTYRQTNTISISILQTQIFGVYSELD